MKKIILLSLLLVFCNLTYAQVINIDVIKNTPSCDGICCGEAEVIASGDNPPFFYQWSNGSSGTNIFNLVSGTYTITVTDANGTTAQEVIQIGELGVDHTITEWSPQTCFGDEDVILKDSVIEGLSPFNFSIYDVDDNLISFSNSINDSTHFYENLAGGTTYRIVISDDRVCFSEKMFTTSQKQELLIDAGESINLDPGETYQLLVQTNFMLSNISWFPTTGLSCSDCDNPFVTAQDTNVCYWIEATDLDGCMAVDSICVFTELTSTQNINEDFSFDIFPNPLTSHLNIQTKHQGIWDLRIIDFNGKILFEKNNNQILSTQIDVSNLPDGLYFLKFSNQTTTFSQKVKIIK